MTADVPHGPEVAMGQVADFAGIRRGAMLLVLGVAGCQSQRPATEGEIAAATGVSGAIVFHAQAEGIDAGETPETLTLTEAVRLALTHDPRLQQSLAQVRLAEAEANQARLLPNPVLAIDVRPPVSPGVNTAFEATLTGDLVSLLQKPAQISAADKRLRGASAEALTQALDVISETKLAFVAARGADVEMNNARDHSAILQRLHEIAQSRLNLGEGTRLDLLAIDAQLAQATLDQADLELEVTSDRLTLARLMGSPGGGIAWKLEADNEPAYPAVAAEGAWVSAALQKRPEIQAKVWELRALGDDLSAAEFSPFAGGEIGGHAEHDPEWRVGPTVSVPLPVFDFGQANRARIEAQRAAARQDLLQAQREIVEEIRGAYAAYENARQSLAAAREKLLPLQQQELEQAQVAFQAGASDLATLLLAQSDLQATTLRVTGLEEKAISARIKLERAAGGAIVASGLASTSQPATSPASQPTTGAGP